MDDKHIPQLLPLSEVSEITHLSRSTLYREMAQGRLKSIKIGRAIRVTETELRRYISEVGGV